MKKLMILAIAVASAACVHAAAVTWNSGAFSAGFSDPDGKKLTTAMGYTMTAMFYEDAAMTKAVTTSASSTVNAMTGALSATTGDLFAGDTTYYVKAIIDNGTSMKETDVVSFTTPTTGDGNINFTTGGGLSTGTSAWSSAGWQAAPEPTSGLLLLLGVAGLALKRKKA